MFKTPDYTKYTLEELFEAHASVNRDNYPENYALIKKEIEKSKKAIINVLSVGLVALNQANYMPRQVVLKAY